MYHLFEEIHLRYPFWNYLELFQKSRHVFLLDSAKRAGRFGRYSFMGADPFLVFTAKRALQRVESGAMIREEILKDEGGAPLDIPGENTYWGDPFRALQKLLRAFAGKPSSYSQTPVPLKAGAVGFFGYEAAYFVENLPDRGADDLMLPDIYFGFYDSVLAHDHSSGATWLSVLGRGAEEELAKARANRIRAEQLAAVRDFESQFVEPAGSPLRPLADELPDVDFSGHFDQQAYSSLVQTCKDHIYRGEVYEICLTHRLQAPFAGSGWELYRALRTVNPAPFSSYIRFPGAEVISSSPERFLSLDADRKVECRPIKGTRPRGRNADEDRRMSNELQNSVKDRSENVMIVDLVRNDLGKVCETGSVSVPELFKVEKYATVFQLVSTICGTLEKDLDAIDLVRATFPGGSMTGAPKIAAMKIIDRLEPFKRGIYSGSIGYIDYGGGMDLSIVIRTIILKEGMVYFNVGGAIVADSDAKAEYQETMDKASALKMAIRQALTGMEVKI